MHFLILSVFNETDVWERNRYFGYLFFVSEFFEIKIYSKFLKEKDLWERNRYLGYRFFVSETKTKTNKKKSLSLYW